MFERAPYLAPKRVLRWTASFAAIFVFLGLVPAPDARAAVPTGFADVIITTALSSPTAFAFAPDGRIFVCQQGGALRVVKNDALLATPAISLTVDARGERGLLGVAFDPAFTTNNYIYLYYTVSTSPIHNRVSRFTMNGDVVVAGSEVQILNLDNLSGAQNHNGGAIHFGPDGKLYVAVGENATGSNAQSFTNRLGKMLRINSDGSIPADNPTFGGQTTGANRAIWAMGLRNPYTFTFQNGTGRMYINDVGEVTWEEINDGVAGSNYGWPTSEGPTSNPSFKGPEHAYQHTGGACAITGGAFYSPTGAAQYPAQYVGKYFFADYCGDWIKYIDPANPASSTQFATGLGAPVDIQLGPDAALYYIARDSGKLARIVYTSNLPTITNHPQNQTVSAGQTATFTATAAGAAPLQYQWQRNGVNIPGANSATYSFTAQAADNGATFRVIVSNGFGSATSNSATLTVSGTSNTPPVPTITAPAAGTLYSGGQTINYAGTATDAQDGTLPASAFTWEVVFHHDTHTHPFVLPTTGQTSGSFTIPTQGETAANVWYRINLTVRDSNGAMTTVFRDVLPRTVDITLQTIPRGLQVTLDGQPMTTPLTVTGVVGITREIGVPLPQTVNGVTYSTFGGWSDGGARVHNISTPGTSTTYTATLVADNGPTKYPLAGNFDGTGGDTIGLYFPQTATFALRNSNSAGAANLAYAYGASNSGWISLVGDWDGNGTDTPGVFQPATNVFLLKNSHAGGNADLAFQFGAAGNGWIPLVGDWDGNGTDTIGLYDPVAGVFYLRNSNSTGIANTTFNYGPVGANIKPIVGDWNNNVVDTIGVYDATTSIFYLRNTNSAGFADATFQFGPPNSGWVPIAGKWAADLNGVGLYDRINGVFYLKNQQNAGNADFTFQYGAPGNRVVPSKR